ncbi:AMP-binding protein [Desulfallas sp. Bu1-1]|nr:AMP-binding protein [Desulfallas sp. Bu1-1]
MEFGCAIARLVLVTVNSANKAKELEYVLRQSDAAGLFLTDEYRGHNMLATANQVRNNLPSLREIICITDFEHFMNTGNRPTKFPEIRPEAPFVIMYTSGTTGYPKGAILHNKGMTNSTNFMAERAGMKAGGAWIM